MVSNEIMISGTIGTSIYVFIFWSKCFRQKYPHVETKPVNRSIYKIKGDKQTQTEDICKEFNQIRRDFVTDEKDKKDKCFQTEDIEKVSIGTDVCFEQKRTENQCLQTDFPRETEVTEAVEETSKVWEQEKKDKCFQTENTEKVSIGTDVCFVKKSTEEKCLQTDYPKETEESEKKKDKCFQTEDIEKVSIGTNVCFVKKSTEDQCLQTDFPKVIEVTGPEDVKCKIWPSMTENDDVIDGYPPPEPPHLTKSEVFSSRGFSDVKQRALQVPEIECNSYESLLRYLCGHFESDFQKVYAIFCWIINRPISVNDEDRNRDSPFIMQGKGTSTNLMSKMCRKINIPCFTVQGYDKNGTYEVGDVMTKEKHSSCWNVVYIERNWWLVYCNGASSTSNGENRPEFRTAQENQLESGSSPLKALSRDFYFLTDPSIFIHTFFPFDDRWQLLSKIVSLEEFESRPFLYPAFHFLKLEFADKDIACTDAISETFNLKIRIPQMSLGKLSFDYKISRLNPQEHESLNMKKYSLHYIIDDVAYFDFRFPAAAVGYYKLQIFGKVLGHVTSTVPLCEFKLKCEKGIELLAPLPVDADVGWGGTSAKLEEHGVEVVSHANGLYPWVEDEMKFEFAYPEHSDAKAELMKIDENEKHFEKSVNTEKKGHNVNVSVNPPLHEQGEFEQGEFVLKIYIRGSNASEFVNVCNYLLERTETQSQRKARERLLKLLRSEDVKPTEVQKAKDEFQKSGGKDFGEVAKAERKMHNMSLKKAIEELRRYNNPPDSVLDIVHATCIILGRDEKDILKWKRKKRLLRKIEVTLSEFDVKHVSADSLTRAKDLLQNMHSAKARNSSAAAAELYDWVITLIKEMEEQN